MPRSRDQPLGLHPRRHIHDHDLVEAVREMILGKQRDVVDHDRRLVRRLLQFAHPRANQGMDDGVQLSAQRRVREDELAEPFPVQGTVGAEHPLAEGLDHLGQSRRAGRHDLPGQQVSVDDDGTVGLQPPGYLALARADPAGEPDSERRHASQARA